MPFQTRNLIKACSPVSFSRTDNEQLLSESSNFGPRVANRRRHHSNVGTYLHPNMVRALPYIPRRYNSAAEATSLLSSVASLAKILGVLFREKFVKNGQLYHFGENLRRGRQARNFTTNVPKIDAGCS